MSNRFAQFISILLNPIFILALTPLLLIYRTTHDAALAYTWTLYTLLFLACLSAFIIYGVKKKMFIDFDVSRREQRPLLFVTGFIFMVLYISGLFIFHAPNLLVVLSFGVLIAVVVVSIINMRIKASIHVATVSALIVASSIDLRGYYFSMLLLIPIVGWARVKEKKHNVPEAVTGGIVGSLLSIGLYAVLESGFHF